MTALTTGQALGRHSASASSFSTRAQPSQDISDRWQVVSGCTVCYNSRCSPRKALAALGSSLSVSRCCHLDLAEK
jgi:outer membrane receptor for ferrienterochelin and colicin